MFFWRFCFFLFIWFFSQILNVYGQVTVTGSNGANSTYSSLRQAFTAINSSSQTGQNIIITLTGSTTETATAVLNNGTWTKLIIYPSISSVSVSGNLAAPLIDLNGADNITIDGRVNSTGSLADLTIVNNSNSNAAGTSAIRFINDATGNSIKYCNLKGSSTSATSGILLFSTAGTGTGNDANLIDNNNITNSTDLNRPINAVYSSGTNGKENSGNTISNNNIYDFLNRSNLSAGINLDAFTTSWTINANSFYETVSFTATASIAYSIILIKNSSGINFTVTGNYIGGKAPHCGSTAWTKSNSQNNAFTAIDITAGSGTPSSIQNNIIQNFVWSNSGASTWTGIRISGGDVNAGTTTGNIIGSATGTGSVTFNAGATDAVFYGINLTGTGTVNIQNNNIGSITTSNSAAASSTNFTGIYKSAGTGVANISYNLIGSTVTANSINTGSVSSGNPQTVYGINNDGTGNITISNNIISNLKNGTTNGSANTKGVINGITSTSGTNTIKNNDIHNLTIANCNTSTTNTAAVCGIALTGSTLKNISANSIYNLTNSYLSFAGNITGIYFTGNNGANTVSQNYIHSLSVTGATYGNASIYGIKIAAGSATYSNNIISIKGNTPTTIYGIYETGVAGENNNLYFNTVYIGGTPASGRRSSYALWSNTNTNTRNFRNNILYNERSNSGATGSHFAIRIQGITSLMIDYNNYYVSGTGGILGRIGTKNRTTLALWKSSTMQDANSKSVNPAFALPGGTSASNYIPANGTLLATAETGITTDYAGTSRSATYPAMGAYEVTIIPGVEVYKASMLQAGYSSLQNAFNAINSGIHTGALEIRINNNTTETSAAVLNASGTGSANYTSLLIFPTSAGVAITGALATPLINLNGADNVTIDGRINASGTSRDLTIINTSTSAAAGTSTIRFINDATNNIVKFCNIRGSCTSAASGILFFSSTTGTTGNDDNLIDNNNITNTSSVSRPLNAVYSAGTSAKENSSNIISNNNIYDILNMGIASNCINIGAFSTSWTIASNSFYESGSFVPTASVTFNIILINNTSGTDFTVTGNFIGGSAPSCGGSAWIKTNASDNIFTGINISSGTATASSIQNNTIQNINWSNSASAVWTAIGALSGDINIGTNIGNTIGAATGTGSLTITGGTTPANVYGLNIYSSGTVICQNNKIGSILTANTNSANATNFYGINKTASAGTLTITNNTIGSTTTTNSIFATSPSSANSAASAQVIYGIFSSGTGNVTISNNTISNLNNGTTNTKTGIAGLINGITTKDGTNTISNNIIRYLTISNASTNNDNWASVCGISVSGNLLKTVTGNTIYNLLNSFSSFSGNIIGLYFSGSAVSNTVSGSFIYNISVTNPGDADVYGIKIAAGTTTYSNNIISLGGITATTIYGIFDPGTSGINNSLYFNTIYIGGSLSSGVTNTSYAFYCPANGSTRNIRNNIFMNARSTTGAVNKHFAIYLATTGGTLTVNYNDYWVSGTGGTPGYYGANRTTLPVITGQDANSLSINPAFSTAGGTLALNYSSAASLPGVSITGITTDYFGALRSAIPKMGALEAQDFVWLGGLGTDFATAGNWAGGVVPSDGSDISFAANPTNHCFLDQNRTLRNITNAQNTDMLVLNSKQLTLTGNLVFSGGAKIDATSFSSVIIFAGTMSQAIPAGGFLNNIVNRLTINNINNVSLYGTLILNGTISSLAGRLDAYTNSPAVEYGTASSLLIPDGIYLDNTIHSLTVNNTGITFITDFTIHNNLTINGGRSLYIAAGKSLSVSGNITNSAGSAGFVLQSDATGTAQLMYSNSNVAATVQRYISGAAESWHFISSPVSNQQISGDWIPAGTYGNGTGYDLYVWDEATNCWVYRLNTTSMVNWNTVHPSNNFVAGRGYLYSVQVANPVKEFAGTLNNGNVSFTMTTVSSEIDLVGFNLVGNPYPSTIDWSATSGWTRSNLLLSDTGYDMWIWNSSVNNYGIFNSTDVSGVGTNGVTRYIPPMQGFFVCAETPGNLIFSNSVKALNGTGNWIKKGFSGENNIFSIKISSVDGFGSDEVQLHFGKEKNSSGAAKLFSYIKTAPSLFMNLEEKNYSILNLTDTIENPAVPVSFKPGINGRYTINCNFDHDKFETVLLEDRLNHYLHDLRLNGVYSFSAKQNDKDDRFILHFAPLTSSEKKEIPARIFVLNGKLVLDMTMISGNSEMIIYDMPGRVLMHRKLSGETKNEISLDIKTQLIIVCLNTNSGSIRKKVMWINN